MAEGWERRNWIHGPRFILSEGEESWRVMNYHIFRIFLNKLRQLHSISPRVEEEAFVHPQPGR